MQVKVARAALAWVLALPPIGAAFAAPAAVRSNAPRATVTPWRYGSFVRVPEHLDGWPVLDAGGVQMHAPDGTPLATSRSRHRATGSAPGTTIGAYAAEQAAHAALGRPARAVAVDRGLLARLGGRAVWRVDLLTSAPVVPVRAWIDAADGAVLWLEDRRRTAIGRVYDPNPIVAPAPLEVPLVDLVSPTSLEGTYVIAHSCLPLASDCVAGHRAAPDAAGDYLFDPLEGDPQDPFAEVMAYVHGDRTARFFGTDLGFAWTCGGRTEVRLIANVQAGAGVPVDNAYAADIDGDGCAEVLLGQGRLADFAYDADVIYHELTHAVVDRIAALDVAFDRWGIDQTPLALDEGTADYFSATVSGDPEAAEYVAGRYAAVTIGGSEVALRSADNARRCPNDLAGEPHYDGQIWSGTGWELRARLGRAKADPLMFAAVGLLPPSADFADVATALRAAAGALSQMNVLSAGDLAVVDAVVARRGLTGCARWVPLDDGAAHLVVVASTESLGGFVSELPASIGHVVAPPDPGAQTLSMDVQIESVTAGTLYSVAVRRDRPVEWRLSGSGFAPVADGRFDGSPPRIRVDASTDPAFDPTAGYYFSVINRGPGPLVVRLTGRVQRIAARATVGGGGCSCSFRAGAPTGTDAPVPLAALVAATAIATRRRCARARRNRR